MNPLKMNSNVHFKKDLLPKVGLPRWLSGKEPACQYRRCELDPWVGKIPCRRKWQPAPVFFPGKSHGQRSLAGYSPWGHTRVGQDWATEHTRKCMYTYTDTPFIHTTCIHIHAHSVCLYTYPMDPIRATATVTSKIGIWRGQGRWARSRGGG